MVTEQKTQLENDLHQSRDMVRLLISVMHLNYIHIQPFSFCCIPQSHGTLLNLKEVVMRSFGV